MKRQFFSMLSICLVFSFSAFADQEIEIEFRLQPDGTGAKTRNQGITVEDDDVEIYLDGNEREIDSSTVDTPSLLKLVTSTIHDFEFIDGERIRAPYIEVKMEFSGEDREIEVSHRYPLGKLPAPLIQLQQKYLDVVWQ